MPTEKRPLKVFLCHASQDKPMIRELSQRLFAEGWIDPWLDEKKLLPGQDWRLKIEEAVETSDIVIICLSNNSVSKEGFVQRELRYAREIALEKPEESIFLIPLRLDDCTVPRGLRFYQWVDYFGEKKDEAYSALVESLRLRYEQKLILEKHERIQKEKAKQEIAERIAREKAEHEAIEKDVREKVEREKAERAAQEKLEWEAAEQARREKAAHEATEKAAREKAKHDAAEKARRERAERRAAQIIALKETFSKFFNSLRLDLPKAIPFIRIAGIIGIVAFLFWVGSWVMPQILPFVSFAKSSMTLRSNAIVASSTSLIPLTKTLVPRAIPTKPVIPSSTALPNEITDTKGVSMVLVSAGRFLMGFNGGNSNNSPVHQVYLDTFYIDKYEVTNVLYKACVNADKCALPKRKDSLTHSDYFDNADFNNYPVINVNWNMANAYCEWREARLPTEAEWEKAARGTDARSYPWGVNINCFYANGAFSDSPDYCIGDTTDVGSYPDGVSPYGVHDMIGNVQEWVSSLYKPYPYDMNDGREQLASTERRVQRGGSYNSSVQGGFGPTTAFSRYTGYPNSVFPDTGFRCAKNP